VPHLLFAQHLHQLARLLARDAFPGVADNRSRAESIRGGSGRDWSIPLSPPPIEGLVRSHVTTPSGVTTATADAAASNSRRRDQFSRGVSVGWLTTSVASPVRPE
jgi:hypothetical protein